MANKSFRIWKRDGEPKNIKASKVEFERQSSGLLVTFRTGRNSQETYDGVVALTEIMPPIIIEKK